MELAGHQEPPVLVDLREQVETVDHLVLPDQMDLAELQVSLDLLELQDQVELQGNLDLRGHLDLMDLQELQESLDLQELQDQVVLQVNLDLRELPGLTEQPVLPVLVELDLIFLGDGTAVHLVIYPTDTMM